MAQPLNVAATASSLRRTYILRRLDEHLEKIEGGDAGADGCALAMSANATGI
jgi:hypothetical protein